VGTPADGHELETERLRLRPLTAADEEDYHGLFSDPEVVRYLGPGGVRSREENRAALETAVEHWRRHGYGIWKVTERVGGRFVGRCGLRYLDGVNAVELLYTLHKAFWGRGLATEAAAAAVGFAFGRAGLARLVALADPENRASQRVMEKLGFRYERSARFKGGPALWYALGRDDSPAARP
jgi:ribosomal-protein-alanine N-acetyltransferase